MSRRALRFTRKNVGELELRCALAGDEAAPLVVLLHGFPELWYGWRHQLSALADAGYFVVAPDQRGYGDSDKPPKARAYRREHLVHDVSGLVRAFGREQTRLVGHDWGGAVAWLVAQRQPELVEKLCVLNCPHPDVLARALLTEPRQLKKSWYMFLFQLPYLAETLARRDDYGQAVRFLKSSAPRGTFSDDDVRVYREAWRKPGAMKAMLDWYRAAARYDSLEPDRTPIAPDTLLIWGKRDIALGPWLVEPTLALCERARVAWIEEAGHFVQHEAPARVNELLLAHLAA